MSRVQSVAHTTVLLHEAVDALVTDAGRHLRRRHLRPRRAHARAAGALSAHGRARDRHRSRPGRRRQRRRRRRRSSPTRASRSCTRASRADDWRRSPRAASVRSTACCWTSASRSPQIDNPARGFSFRFDGPLDMRMDTTRGESAAELLARADERHIAEVIRDYGEERFAVSDCKGDCCSPRRAGALFEPPASLSAVVAGAVKTREPGQNPATRTFQALRIFVNAELEELEQALKRCARRARSPGGRLVRDQLPLAGRPHRQDLHRAREQERRSTVARRSRADRPHRAARARAASSPGRPRCATNPRARSAMLRVAETDRRRRRRSAP